MKFRFLRKLHLFFQAFVRSGSDTQDPKYRLGVGIMLVNKQGKIFVGKRTGYSEWQMPQGGVDFYQKKPEPSLKAAWRELWEEVGVQEQCQLVTHTRQAYSYDFPPFSFRKFNLWKLWFNGQKQIWYGFLFSGTDSDIDLNATIHPEFTAWKWIDKQELIADCTSFKRSVYVGVLKELWPFMEAALSSSSPVTEDSVL
ncbi:RNA pyrophosphohydrolase [Holospora curviuscula]|uniref:RNA pyrophosphohydrolase n=1 Tax=Holospora curviuscula TaxID=1082868 RepID=A0A2S5REX2_9PROT|nr:RNA pyrophosphohydrolase [Holospora curviuscula]PPE05685.1 RNA pyrophosphohydrolase [Holospora curviuscula]